MSHLPNVITRYFILFFSNFKSWLHQTYMNQEGSIWRKIHLTNANPSQVKLQIFHFDLPIRPMRPSFNRFSLDQNLHFIHYY